MSDFDELANKLDSRHKATAETEKASKNKDEEPDIRMNIRIEKHLRDAFVACCRDQDTTAARELRNHMRKYVKEHGQGRLL